MLENRCPSCNSARVEGIGRQWGCLGLLLWPWSMIWKHPRKRCKECSAVWRT